MYNMRPAGPQMSYTPTDTVADDFRVGLYWHGKIDMFLMCELFCRFVLFSGHVSPSRPT